MKKLFAIISVLLVLMILPFAVGASDGAVATRADVNLDGEVTKDDAIYLLMYTFFPDDYPIENKNVDYNGDGTITKDDAIYLLMYTFFPEDYPIDDENAFAVSSLGVDADTGKVTASVSAVKDCSLLVRFIDEDVYFAENFPANRVYLEDGAIFAKTAVKATEGAEISASVTGELPEYFVAEAVLVDGDGNELGGLYYDITNTKRYESFANMSREDFGADDKVIELEGVGLAVLADDVKMITAESVTQEKGDNGIVYSILAPSVNISAGDKIYATAPDCVEGVLFQAETVSAARSELITVTSLTSAEAGELNLSEFYKYLRADATYVIGLYPEGKDLPQNVDMPYAVEVITKELNDNAKLTAEVSGAVTIDVQYIYSPLIFKELPQKIYKADLIVDADIDTLLTLYAESDGGGSKFSSSYGGLIGKDISLPLGLGLYYYLDTSFDMSFEASGAVSVNLNTKAHSEVHYDRGDYSYGGSRMPEFTPSFDHCEGEVEIDFGPTVGVGVGIVGRLLEMGTEIHTGVLIEGELIGKLCDAEQAEEDGHLCDICVDGEISKVFNIDVLVDSKLNGDDPLWEKNIYRDTEHIEDFYASVLCTEDVPEFDKIGWGDCPNIAGELAYKVNPDGTTCTVTGLGTYRYTDVIIPETLGGYTVTAINSDAFFDGYGSAPTPCKLITSVYIPNTVTNIGEGAFCCCKSLKSVYIPNSVTSIGKSAFFLCDITSIKLPASVTNIEWLGLSACNKLEQILIDENNTFYHSEGNCIIETETKILKEGCKNSEIPSDGSVTVIGTDAFRACKELKTIYIPNTITTIDDEAFIFCTNLESIEIPDSVTVIGNRAFSCDYSTTSQYKDNPNSNLKSVKIGNGVLSIGEDAFNACDDITSIIIPDSVKHLGISAFENCLRLANVKIGNGVTSINEATFYNCVSLKNIEIGNSVTSIGEEAFSGCASLESVNIPDSVITIGEYCFEAVSIVRMPVGEFDVSKGETIYYSNCGKLKNVNLGKNVKVIGDYAFLSCTALTEFTIPESVEEIGLSALRQCDNLTTLYYNSSHKLDSRFIPETVTKVVFGCEIIPEDALRRVENVEEIVILDNVVSIAGFGVHGLCGDITSLKTVKIGDGITIIPESTFEGCTNLSNVEIGNSVKAIDGSAFYGCTSLTEITIPASVTDIESKAFAQCTNLSVLYYNSSSGFNMYSVFYGIYPEKIVFGGTTVPRMTMMEYVTDIPEYVITNSVHTIGYNAFKDWTWLTSIELPSSVRTIEDSAFSGCKALKSIDLSHVRSIGNYAFRDTGINSVWLAGGTRVGSGAFNDGCVIQYASDVNTAASYISGYQYYTIYCTDGKIINGNKIYYEDD